MLDLNKICQPGERITIITRETIIVGTVPETYHPHGGARDWAAKILDPLTSRQRMCLRTHDFRACASEVGIEVEVVRERGTD